MKIKNKKKLFNKIKIFREKNKLLFKQGKLLEYQNNCCIIMGLDMALNIIRLDENE